MKIFTESELIALRIYANTLLYDLDRHKNAEEKWRIEWVMAQLKEACSMGYSIAFDEVRSTPWEYQLSSMALANQELARGCQMHMNVLSEIGWELFMVCESWLIWRRRKIEKPTEANQ